MKDKLNKAIELLTQLRVELVKSKRDDLEAKTYEAEMLICESIDILNQSGEMPEKSGPYPYDSAR